MAFITTTALDLSLILCLHLHPLSVIGVFTRTLKLLYKSASVQGNYHSPGANIKMTKSEMWVSMTRCYPAEVDSRAEDSVNHAGPMGLQQ